MLAGKKILVVDDEPDLREILRDEFELEGAEVQEAPNGREAFAKAQSTPFDLVVTDIRMPGGDGISLARNIKSLNSEKPGLILITGFADITPEEAYDLGVEVFYSKPFNLESFRASVEKLMKPPGQRFQGAISGKNLPPLSISDDFDAALTKGSLQLGRGGAFVKTDQILWKIGDQIPIQVGAQFSAWAQVRWIRSDQNPGFPAGVGIEFVQLPEDSFKLFDSWVSQNHPLCFIPRR